MPPIYGFNHLDDLMTLSARTSTTGLVQATTDIPPVTGMRVDPEPGSGAVALQTDIPFGVTSLAGRQVFPGFPSMVARPGMGRQNRIHMAALTLGLIVKCMLSTQRSVSKPAPVGIESQIIAIERRVTGVTVI